MLRYLGNDNYEYVPQHGEPIKLHIDDINHIAEESEAIEESYVWKQAQNRDFWANNYKDLKSDIRELLNKTDS